MTTVSDTTHHVQRWVPHLAGGKQLPVRLAVEEQVSENDPVEAGTSRGQQRQQRRDVSAPHVGRHRHVAAPVGARGGERGSALRRECRGVAAQRLDQRLVARRAVVRRNHGARAAQRRRQARQPRARTQLQHAGVVNRQLSALHRPRQEARGVPQLVAPQRVPALSRSAAFGVAQSEARTWPRDAA